MDTVRRFCEEAQRAFDPSLPMAENLAGVSLHHRAAVAVWHFVQDMDEGGFALWFERGQIYGKLWRYLGRMNCKATQKLIQVLRLAYNLRNTEAKPDYAALDSDFKGIRDDFCAAAEKFIRKCPGCPAESINGPHKMSCSYFGAHQVVVSASLVGDRLVATRRVS